MCLFIGFMQHPPCEVARAITNGPDPSFSRCQAARESSVCAWTTPPPPPPRQLDIATTQCIFRYCHVTLSPHSDTFIAPSRICLLLLLPPAAAGL